MTVDQRAGARHGLQSSLELNHIKFTIADQPELETQFFLPQGARCLIRSN